MSAHLWTYRTRRYIKANSLWGEVDGDPPIPADRRLSATEKRSILNALERDMDDLISAHIAQLGELTLEHLNEIRREVLAHQSIGD